MFNFNLLLVLYSRWRFNNQESTEFYSAKKNHEKFVKLSLHFQFDDIYS